MVCLNQKADQSVLSTSDTGSPKQRLNKDGVNQGKPPEQSQTRIEMTHYKDFEDVVDDVDTEIDTEDCDKHPSMMRTLFSKCGTTIGGLLKSWRKPWRRPEGWPVPSCRPL